MLWSFMLCNVMFYYDERMCVVLCYVILCCVVLCYGIFWNNSFLPSLFCQYGDL